MYTSSGYNRLGRLDSLTATRSRLGGGKYGGDGSVGIVSCDDSPTLLVLPMATCDSPVSTLSKFPLSIALNSYSLENFFPPPSVNSPCLGSFVYPGNPTITSDRQTASRLEVLGTRGTDPDSVSDTGVCSARRRRILLRRRYTNTRSRMRPTANNTINIPTHYHQNRLSRRAHRRQSISMRRHNVIIPGYHVHYRRYHHRPNVLPPIMDLPDHGDENQDPRGR